MSEVSSRRLADLAETVDPERSIILFGTLPSSSLSLPPGDMAQDNPAARPLNVTDALTYLDAVKNQFQDNLDVYNHFLDIMKDFKSQRIDTPGVIQRVSKLFHGYSDLIQGFNTFLPVGYRIDVSSDPSDNTIIVTTPSGTTTQSTGGGPPLVAPRLQLPHPFAAGAHGPSDLGLLSPGIPSQTAASYLSNLNPVLDRQQPAGEFNHAIQYLNKIKHRFSDEPSVYKQFLDILQTYQKEQKHSQDSQVYGQVQALFKDAQDLLEEFKDFLPDIVGPGLASSGASAGMMPPSWPGDASPPSGNKKLPPTSKRKQKRGLEKDPTPGPSSTKGMIPNRNKKVKHHHMPEDAYSPYMPPHSPTPAHAYPPGGLPHPHMLPPHVNGPNPHFMQDYTAATSSAKLLFFDRARKNLDRDVYDEFLKVLSLFAREVLDMPTLVERSKAYLTDELVQEFKDLIGWEDKKADAGPPHSTRSGPPEFSNALLVDDGEGPSYRRLPLSEVKLACSGRDELCRSVLNDEWASHPTWASEEAGFIVQKKTAAEDVLFRVEEERHEYFVQIEGLLRTIGVLEPIYLRLEEMSGEERAMFRLKADFGGTAPSIYHRTIKKIYGKDHAKEVIEALQECPAVAVPVVLQRLKTKDEEWRRSQRVYSRDWLQSEFENFYKSLDYQGMVFKQNDKKNVTTKHFVQEIQQVKAKQVKKVEGRAGSGSKTAFGGGAQVGHQLEFSFGNREVLDDAVKLVLSVLDHSQGGYSPLERRQLEKFIKTFVPIAFMQPSSPGEEMEEGDQEMMACSSSSSSSSSSASSGRKSAGTTSPYGLGLGVGGVPPSDLRKKLLKTAQEKARVTSGSGSVKAPKTGSKMGSRAASPGLAEGGHGLGQLEQDVWIREASTCSGDALASVEKNPPFFVNTTFYTLVRLFELLYSRLVMAYDIGAKYAKEKHASLLANPIAVELGLDDPNGPALVLAQYEEVMGSGAFEANVGYMYLLSVCEKLFSGEMDQATYEEHLRWFFGTKSYYLFTLDKLILALIKQVQTILGDHRCQELWGFMKSAHGSRGVHHQDIIRYRREAERHVGQDDHLYHLQWMKESKTLRVSLFSSGDPSRPSDGTRLGRWKDYVRTYVMTHPTEWVPTPNPNPNPNLNPSLNPNPTPARRKRSVFLHRTVQSRNKSGFQVDQSGEMTIRIALPTYKIIYESGGEDSLVVTYPSLMMKERARVREEERRRCSLLR